MPGPRALAILGLLAAMLRASPAGAAVVLYDGALGAGDQDPEAQGWAYQCNIPPQSCSTTRIAAGGITTLDSTAAQGDKVGYSSNSLPQMPVLERNLGYRIRFDVRVASESHSKVTRAGFSIIALSHDLKGVEIGFWQDEVWTQNDQPIFTHGEGAAFDTTRAIVRYELCVQGSQYALTADGQPLLAGSLRDYAANGGCAGIPLLCPYQFPDLLFLGDDTTSAKAILELSYVEVSAGLALPVIGNTLVVTRNGTDLVLSVSPLSPADGYRRYRDVLPSAIGTTLYDTSSLPTFPPDTQSLPAPDSFYFTVTGTGACGGEFP